MLLSIVLSCLLATLVSGKSSSRILNGNNSNGLPYQVRLETIGCGGSIIKPNWVLTAKHCVVKNMTAGDYRVALPYGKETILAGVSNLQDPDGQRREILLDAITLHDSSDLALLRIDPPFELNDKTKPIEINHNNGDLADYDILISGWGETTNEKMPDQLQEAVVTMRNYEEDGKWGNLIHLWTPDGRGACFGDSGGPAAIKEGKHGELLLVGVASTVGSNCGVSMGATEEENNGPRNSYYVDVFQYADWIEKKIGVA